ncbi:hypothetical protein MW887_000468 [Aspergillus wentii]|nr:hypothetical protein MW887_000468 [Aspergillus wentii]
MMKNIGQEMQKCTKALRINHTYQPRILDLCFAPGGFLATALRLNPSASAMGFSLPPSQGGHRDLLPSHPNIQLKFLDVTMLAEDMGATEIPAGHPDAERFLPRQFADEQTFDLIFCDGQVLRTHERAAYRERREAARLSISQLALGLEHIYPGGTMVVLLHKVEAWDTVKLLYQFSQFSSVRLFKPRKSHSKRSSFYMIARNIQREQPEAIRAIAQWKRLWKAATFGTDQMYLEALNEDGLDPATLLEEFGPRLVKLGRKVWEIQATALEGAPFTQG